MIPGLVAGGNQHGTMTYAYEPFKGRTLDPQKRVRVYRNLHNRGGRWSLLQAGLVVGHADECALADVKFVVRASASNHRTGPRAVVAFAEGYWTDRLLVRSALNTPVQYDREACRFKCFTGAVGGADRAHFGATLTCARLW